MATGLALWVLSHDMRRDNIMYVIVKPVISKSPGATQLAELHAERINAMPQGLGRFQTIQHLRSQGYGVSYSKR